MDFEWSIVSELDQTQVSELLLAIFGIAEYEVLSPSFKRQEDNLV